MEIIREVHCRAMKGLGPEWVDKIVTVCFDDVEPDANINDMIRQDIKEQLNKAGFSKFTINDIHNA